MDSTSLWHNKFRLLGVPKGLWGKQMPAALESSLLAVRSHESWATLILIFWSCSSIAKFQRIMLVCVFDDLFCWADMSKTRTCGIAAWMLHFPPCVLPCSNCAKHTHTHCCMYAANSKSVWSTKRLSQKLQDPKLRWLHSVPQPSKDIYMCVCVYIYIYKYDHNKEVFLKH